MKTTYVAQHPETKKWGYLEIDDSPVDFDLTENMIFDSPFFLDIFETSRDAVERAYGKGHRNFCVVTFNGDGTFQVTRRTLPEGL